MFCFGPYVVYANFREYFSVPSPEQKYDRCTQSDCTDPGLPKNPTFVLKTILDDYWANLGSVFLWTMQQNFFDIIRPLQQHWRWPSRRGPFQELSKFEWVHQLDQFFQVGKLDYSTASFQVSTGLYPNNLVVILWRLPFWIQSKSCLWSIKISQAKKSWPTGNQLELLGLGVIVFFMLN